MDSTENILNDIITKYYDHMYPASYAKQQRRLTIFCVLRLSATRLT